MDKKQSLMDFIFDSQFKAYLELEQTIFESFEMYKETNDDRIKYIIERNIVVGKSQILIMLEILSHTAEDVVRRNFEENLNLKLADLKEIEGKLKGMKK